jgi:peptidase M28-like protein/type IX secretion system substrate protein
MSEKKLGDIMKINLIIILLIALTFMSLLADDYLITVDRQIEIELDLNIYHITENYIIAGASGSDVSVLKEQGEQFNIIDESPWSAHYYLVSHPKDRAFTLDRDLGKVIFNEDNLILLKTQSLEMKQALESGLSFTELKQKKLQIRQKLLAPDVLNMRNRTDIESLIDNVDPDSIGYVIQSLQDFVTRYAFHDNRKEVAEWIQNRFWEIGVEDAVIDSFFYNNYMHYNVVATIPGTLHPDRYVLLGGHHDSIVHFGPDPNPMIAAPGADDNASSVAATLEIARIMMENDYQPDSSIRFVTFAAEEVGLWGAFYYASVLADEGLDIRMMLNCDMIANNSYSPGEWILDIPMYTGSEYLRDISLVLMDYYTTLNFGYSSSNSSGSDSYAFFVNGIPVSYYFEHEFSPHYHSIYDVIDNCDLDYCAQVVRLCGAMISTMEAMPDHIAEFNVVDPGNGNSMTLSWSACEDLDFSHYSIGVGTESGVYDDIYTTTETTLLVNDLEDGVLYYFGLAAVDEDENYSLVNEQTGTPQEIPVAPTNLVADPGWLSIDLSWEANSELDLAGYYIFKTNVPDSEPVQINTEPYLESTYHDTDVVPGTYYYYKVRAVDQDENVSDQSNSAEARPVSLDSGLLVIDDTEDGNGSFMHPLDEDSDEFILNILDDFTFEWLDNTMGHDPINLSEFGPYSTVLWLMNSASYDGSISDTRDDIAAYLDLGGNFIFIGFRPSMQLDDTEHYPAAYSEGDLLYDYFDVGSADYSQLGRFYYADSQFPGIEDVNVDTLKTPVAFNYHLYNVESIEPINPYNIVFSYGSLFDDDLPFGVMNGSTVGIINETDTFRSALFSFPIYYMEEIDARSFLTTLLEEHFGELTGSDDSETVPDEPVILMQNYPNPFNPNTTISFSLTSEITENTELEIYNLKGQKVKRFPVILSGVEGTGNQHSIVWNGTDENNQAVSSGIYFYKLKSGEFEQIKKMLLLK